MTETSRQERRFLVGAAVLSVLLTAWVNPGNLGNIDSARRLRMAHVWWAGGQEVLPEEARVYGTMGRGGVKRGSFGVGQPLVMLPADLVVTTVSERLGLPASAREAGVAFLSQAIVASLALLGAYRLLRRLGFDHVEAGYGTLSLLLLTTTLHYVQNAQENLLMLTLAIWGAERILTWRDANSARALMMAGVLLGAELLVRLTALADAGAAMVMLFALDWRKALRGVRWFCGGYIMMAAVERLVHFVRFDRWTGTYYSGIMEVIDPRTGAPAVFNYTFLRGIRRALWAPSDSIFLFDPLLTWALILILVFWRRVPRTVASYAAGAVCSLAVYVLFYATYMSPTGEASWGDRYVTTPVLMLALLAVPLTLQLMNRMPAWGWVTMGWSLALQLSSLALVVGVEPAQAMKARIPGEISLRFANMWMVWTGEAAQSAVFVDTPPEWRTWNFLPFQMAFRFPDLAGWAIAAWWLLGAAWIVQAVWLLKRLRQDAVRGVIA